MKPIAIILVIAVASILLSGVFITNEEAKLLFLAFAAIGISAASGCFVLVYYIEKTIFKK